MVTVINPNRMEPPIAPIGLDYVVGALHAANIEAEVLDLCLASDPDQALEHHFSRSSPRLVALSVRNTDDCFYPSCRSFVPELLALIERLRALTDAPIVLGGVGYSLFAERLLRETGADFGIRGDGEEALVRLVQALESREGFEAVPGLLWRDAGAVRVNTPAWPAQLVVPTARKAIDNEAYYRRGGQGSLETKRGCPRRCLYCADPVAKGPQVRLRDPVEVGVEAEGLLERGIEVLHLCDGEFNIPRGHAVAICQELRRRRLGERGLRWYAYLAVVPFDRELAEAMKRAGCQGINFTTDAIASSMLETYGQPHRRDDIASAITACKAADLTVMVDLLLGGPGETAESLGETIGWLRASDVDAVGAALGLRVYPGTPMAQRLDDEPALLSSPHLRRSGRGDLDLLLDPTFYVSAALGQRPAALVRELIGDDRRFFPPTDDIQLEGDHNYSANKTLVDLISAGQRGAYWDILRRSQASRTATR